MHLNQSPTLYVKEVKSTKQMEQKMQKPNLSLIVFLLFTFISFPVLGQKQKDKNHFPNKIQNELNLTDIQKEKIQEIRFNHEEIKIEIKSELDKNRLEIKKLISSDDVNENGLLNLVEKSGQLKSDLEKERVKMWLKIRNLLTDEQKEIWKSKFHNLGSRDRMFKRGMRNEFNRNPRPLVGRKGR